MTHAIKTSFAWLPALVVLLAGCESGQSTQVAPQEPLVRPAKVISLAVNDAHLLRSYPGTLEAREEAELAFRVSGQLTELPALAGLRVERGDLLAKLDPTDYRNALAAQQARYDLARTQLGQTEKLLKQKLASQLQFDQANAELKSAQAALQQAKDNLRYTELKAPFAGIVSRVSAENHQPVQAQKPLVSLRSDDQLLIRFSIPESILAQLKRIEDPKVIDAICGQVSFTTHPNKSFRACHHEHESVPDPLTRNYTGWAALEPITEFVALPGMTATITLDLSAFLADQTERQIFAPVEAVFSAEGKQWLWAVDDELTARRREVGVGRIEGGQIEITSGIEPDARIIAAGVSFVREGMKIKPMVKQRGL